MDKTKWYTINYEKVDEIWEKELDSTGIHTEELVERASVPDP